MMRPYASGDAGSGEHMAFGEAIAAAAVAPAVRLTGPTAPTTVPALDRLVIERRLDPRAVGVGVAVEYFPTLAAALARGGEVRAVPGGCGYVVVTVAERRVKGPG